MKRTQKLALIILLILTTLSYQSSATTQTLIKVEVNPLNRANLYFSNIPQYFKSTLSEDKKVIKLYVKNTNFDEKNSRLSSSGIIKEIFLKKLNNDVEISVYLKDKRGYTVALLPYSKAMMIEVFNWQEISPAEDFYRSALLALEEGIIYPAKQLLKKSANENFPNAYVFLGIIYLQEGKIDSALYAFTQAEEKKANIDDLWAGLSQAHQIKGNAELAIKYKNIFFEKTTLKSFPQLPINSINIEQDTNLIDSISQLFALVNRINNDTNKTIEKIDTIKQQTIIAKDTLIDTLKPQAEEGLQIPSWLQDLLIYSSVIIGSLVLVLFIYYLKWRKLQLSKLRKNRANRFSNDISEAQNKITGSAFAAKKYAESEQKQKEEKNEKETATNIISRKEAVQKKEEELAKKLELIAQKIIEAKKTAQETEQKKEENPKEEKTSYTQQLHPRVELALQLQQEQQKLKAETLKSLLDEEIPNEEEKISELAQKLGIDKKTLEAKKKIGSLEKDKESIVKLQEKFKKSNK